jgi:hypothetical protein
MAKSTKKTSSTKSGKKTRSVAKPDPIVEPDDEFEEPEEEEDEEEELVEVVVSAEDEAEESDELDESDEEDEDEPVVERQSFPPFTPRKPQPKKTTRCTVILRGAMKYAIGGMTFLRGVPVEMDGKYAGRFKKNNRFIVRETTV